MQCLGEGDFTAADVKTFDTEVQRLTGGIPRSIVVGLLGLNSILEATRPATGTHNADDDDDDDDDDDASAADDSAADESDVKAEGAHSPHGCALPLAKRMPGGGVLHSFHDSHSHRREVLHLLFFAIRRTTPSDIIVEQSHELHELWLKYCMCAVFNMPVKLPANDDDLKKLHRLPLFGDVSPRGDSMTLRVPDVALRYIRSHCPAASGQLLGCFATIPSIVDVNAVAVFERLSRLKFLLPTLLTQAGLRCVRAYACGDRASVCRVY